jgi:hypothetical protein
VLQAAQELDEDCRAVRANILPQFVLRNNLLFRQGQRGLQLVVPQALRTAALELAHSNVLAGHLASGRTLTRLRARFHWSTMEQDCAKFVAQCEGCQKFNHSPPKDRALGSTRVFSPAKRIAMDFAGPFAAGFLVIKDLFGRYRRKYCQTKAVLLMRPISEFLSQLSKQARSLPHPITSKQMAWWNVSWPL